MVKLARLFILIVILTFLLFGCTPNIEQPEQTVTPEQTAAGGVSEYADNINVKDIDIAIDGEETVVTLSMISGSRAAGYTESKLVKPPEYEIIQLPQPQRLMIKLSDISFWDYEQKTEWALSNFVLGIFREVPADNDSLIIYIQLSQKAEFSVQETEGDLVIRLMPGLQNESSMFYCVSNSFFEHQDGTWPDNIDMMPVLCSDAVNKILISQPFDTRQKADEFLETAKEQLEKNLPDKKIYVIELLRNSLPDYISGDYVEIEEKNVVMKQGVLMDTPVLLQNGRYLDTSSDGRIAFSRSYKPEEPSLEQDGYLTSEKLWIQDPNGRIQNIDVDEFFLIDDAAFSADGRYISILDVSIENRVLYVYDFQTQEPQGLINLGEEGFGNQTAAFAWSDTENKLYAMTGQSAMQMMVCEFSPDGTFEINAVEEEAGSEGNLEVSQGRVFFADKVSDTVYEISDTKREITDGIDIRISPDGKNMLVLEASSQEGEQILLKLKLCDIKTGETTYIAEDPDIMNFYFMHNGTKVYYTKELFEDDDYEPGYKFGLFSYDIMTGVHEQAAFCSTGDFIPSDNPGEIYLIDSVKDTQNNVYATSTYVYDLSL